MQTKDTMSFHPQMIDAIQAGHKTQTRRVVDPQPIQLADGCWHYPATVPAGFYHQSTMQNYLKIYCPYGQVGDVLSLEGYFGFVKIKITELRVEQLHNITKIDCVKEGYPRQPVDPDADIRDTPLTAHDYFALYQHDPDSVDWDIVDDGLIDWFSGLWDTIYGDDPVKGWDANPWVWVIGFERVEA